MEEFQQKKKKEANNNNFYTKSPPFFLYFFYSFADMKVIDMTHQYDREKQPKENP